jgi:hypothetical protein
MWWIRSRAGSGEYITPASNFSQLNDKARAMLQKRAGFFMSGGMRKELRSDQNYEAQAEGNCGDGVQDVAQAFIDIESAHENLPFLKSAPIGERKEDRHERRFFGSSVRKRSVKVRARCEHEDARRAMIARDDLR